MELDKFKGADATLGLQMKSVVKSWRLEETSKKSFKSLSVAGKQSHWLSSPKGVYLKTDKILDGFLKIRLGPDILS